MPGFCCNAKKSAKAANFGRDVRVIMIDHLDLWKVQVQLCYSRDHLNDIN